MSFVDDAVAALAVAYAYHGLAATWTPAGGAPLPCTILKAEPDEIVGLGKGRVSLKTHRIEVRAVEVAAPAKGDVVQLVDSTGAPIEGRAYRITAAPRRDDYGIEWACEASLT